MTERSVQDTEETGMAPEQGRVPVTDERLSSTCQTKKHREV